MRKFSLGLAIAGLFALASAYAAPTIKIGLNTSVTGATAESGQFEVNGTKIAIDEINQKGGVLGRQLELVVEDNQSSNPGAISAFSKLTSRSDITALVGPIRSTMINALLPNIAKANLPVMIGGSDPTLTQKGNRWVFRCRPNDNYSARVMVDFGMNTLKFKKWAIVHSTDTFGTSGMKTVAANLEKAGVKPLLVQGYTNKQPDFTPVVLAIKNSGADVMATYFTNAEDLGLFGKQLRQLGVNIAWIGSASITADTSLKLAGAALNGTYGIADFNPDANPVAKAYGKKYLDMHKLPADVFSSWAYDAVHVLAKAIESAKSTEPEAIRKAILAINGYQGVEGTYRFDQNGDALRGYNIIKNENGVLKFLQHVEFKD